MNNKTNNDVNSSIDNGVNNNTNNGVIDNTNNGMINNTNDVINSDINGKERISSLCGMDEIRKENRAPVLLSIVIPVYNAADSIECCLDSILSAANEYAENVESATTAETAADAKNVKNAANVVNTANAAIAGNALEVILVDDGSTDGSLSICADYAKKDVRIRVISQKNAGVSAARNKGLQLVRSSYVTFVDADDVVSADYVASVLSLLEHEPELVLFSHYRELKTDEMAEKVFPLEEGYSTDLKKLFEISLTWESNQVWDKVFQKVIIDQYDITFPVGMKTSEDLLFWMTYIRHIKSYYVLNKPLYYYKFSAGGAARNYRLEYLGDLRRVLNCGDELITDYQLYDRKDIFYKTLIWQVLPVLRGLFRKGIARQEIETALKEEVKKEEKAEEQEDEKGNEKEDEKDNDLVSRLTAGNSVSFLHKVYRFLLSHNMLRCAVMCFSLTEKIKGK